MAITRRRFIKGAGAAVGALGLAKAGFWFAPSLPYKAVKVANLKDLKVGEPVAFAYPDAQAQAYLIKLGRPAIGGVGPDRDVVAFTASCTHMGCPVQFKGGRFVCGCHYSMFDPAKNGEVYQGAAVEFLPQIPLRVVRQSGDVFAEGVEGLIWGRVSNLLEG